MLGDQGLTPGGSADPVGGEGAELTSVPSPARPPSWHPPKHPPHAVHVEGEQTEAREAKAGVQSRSVSRPGQADSAFLPQRQCVLEPPVPLTSALGARSACLGPAECGAWRGWLHELPQVALPRRLAAICHPKPLVWSSSSELWFLPMSLQPLTPWQVSKGETL